MKRTSVFNLIALLLLCVCAPVLAQNRMWHAQGQTVVDGSGKAVTLRGVNVGNWLMWEAYMFGGKIQGYETLILTRMQDKLGAEQTARFRRNVQDAFFTEADVAAIAKAGFNVIRLPINYRSLVTEPDCPACDGQGWSHIDNVLKWANAHGIEVILDMHAAPGAQSSLPIADTPIGRKEFWNDSRNAQQVLALWSRIARKFAGNAAVGGYDVLNEPQAPSSTALANFYEQAIKAIRAEDKDHMIWLEGNALSSDLSVFNRKFGDNIGYSTHVYTFPFDQREKRFREAAQLSKAQNVPMWIGEFGISDRTLAQTVQMMNDHAPDIAGWAYWSWKYAAKPGAAPCAMTMPGSWQWVVPWLSGAVLRWPPLPVAIRKGNDDLVAYLRSYRCTPDANVLGALFPR